MLGTMTAPAPPLCAMCPESGIHPCSGCNAIHYCSKQCQASDWSVHKLICTPYKAACKNKPPEARNTLGLYFPEDHDRPHFAWFASADGSGFKDSILTKPLPFHMAGKGVFYVAHQIEFNNLLHRRCDKTLVVTALHPHHAGNEPKAYSGPPTRSFMSIAPRLLEWVRGPFLVYGWSRYEGRRGLTPMDFRHVVDFFLLFLHQREYHALGKVPIGTPKVAGVRLDCYGESYALVQPFVKSIDVATSVCSLPSEVSIPIAERVDLPLVIRKIRPAIAWNDRKIPIYSAVYQDLRGTANIIMLRLNLFDLNDNGPESEQGSFFAVRKDGKPLYPAHLIALNYYASRKQGQLISLGAVTKEQRCQQLSRVCNRDNFENFWKEWLESEKVKRGGRPPKPGPLSCDIDVKSPYEV